MANDLIHKEEINDDLMKAQLGNTIPISIINDQFYDYKICSFKKIIIEILWKFCKESSFLLRFHFTLRYLII